MPMIPSRVGPSEITCGVVLLVEGNGEAFFFDELLKHMQIVPNTDIQTRKVEGKENFRYEFPAFLRDPGFPLVRAYGIIRDADMNAGDALRSIQKLLRDNHQPCPLSHGGIASENNTPKVGVFIMPGNSQMGMLEDLCLRSVKNHPIMPYVENFMARVKEAMQADAPKNESKAKMQAFLSGMSKTVPYLGIAAKYKYWPFDHEEFSDLRYFIQQLFMQ